VAKSKKDADRRAVVEQLRREQQRKERRKTLTVLGAAVTVGAIIIGFAVWQFANDKDAAEELAALGASPSAAGCQDVTTEAAKGSNDHRPEPDPITYEQSPPAFGPHWGQFLQGNQIRPFWTGEDRPPVERLVHSLEHGHTILWYDETIAGDDTAVDEVEQAATKAAQETDGKFMAAPWTESDGGAFPEGAHVALTHWSVGGTNGNPEGQIGVWQYCDGLSGEAVKQFIEDYPNTDTPEPGAP
jgi:hypothetical protein